MLLPLPRNRNTDSFRIKLGDIHNSELECLKMNRKSRNRSIYHVETGGRHVSVRCGLQTRRGQPVPSTLAGPGSSAPGTGKGRLETRGRLGPAEFLTRSSWIPSSRLHSHVQTTTTFRLSGKTEPERLRVKKAG